MDEPDPNTIEQGLADYVAGRYDPARLSELVAYALAQQPNDQPNDRAAAMLRRGGQILIHQLGDGAAEIVIAYTEDSEKLAELRAAVWDGEPEQPPPYGDSARGEMLALARFPISALAALPRG